MDFDEKEQRYKQVKSVNGGGTKHLSISKGVTVADIQVMAENLFFPNGHSKKNKTLSHYSTHIESSQTHVDMFNTVEELYNQSKVKILRLYLCTKKKTGQHSSVGEEGYLSVIQPSLTDPTDSKRKQAVEDLFVENRDSESSNHHEMTDGASTSEELELNDTWDRLQTLGEGSNSAFIHETDKLNIIEVDIPAVEESLSAFKARALAGATDSQAVPVQQSCPVTLIVRKGQCLRDLISAFKDPEIIKTQVDIKVRSPTGELEEREGSGVFQDCLTEFWTDFYDSCTRGVEVKVPFIRHDFQCEDWQAAARVFVVGWNQAGYFPMKLAIPFLEEVLYGSTASSFKDALLLYVSQEEKAVLLKALEDFQSVDTDELFNVLNAHECKQFPTKDTLLCVLTQIGHKTIIQAPMYVIKCWHPIVASVANLPSRERLHEFIAQRKQVQKQ